MVTHSVKAASHAAGSCFCGTARCFHQLYRGLLLGILLSKLMLLLVKLLTFSVPFGFEIGEPFSTAIHSQTKDRPLVFLVLFMVQLFGLVFGLAGQVDAQLAAHVFVPLGQDYGGMGLTAPQFWSCSIASSAVGLVAAQMDRATSSSSVCRRGFELPRWLTFRSCIGSMMTGDIK